MSRIIIDPAGDVLLSMSTRRPSKPISSVIEPGQVSSNGGPSSEDPAIITGPEADDESSNNTLELLVSSKVLSVTSPVFNAMFYGKFSEGVALSTITNAPDKQPYRLPLPDDDAEAMTLLCQIIHFNLTDVSPCPTPKLLEKLATVCDKYNCATALHFCGSVWIRNWLTRCENDSETTPRIVDICRLLVFAYVADLSFEFSEVCWKLLLYHKGPLTGPNSQVNITNHPLLHEDVLEYLNKKRAIFCGAIHKAAMEPLTTWKWETLSRGCYEAAKVTAQYTLMLRNQCLFPYDLEFSKHQFSWLLNLDDRVDSLTVSPCPQSRHCPCAADQNENLYGPLQSIIKLIRNKKTWYGCLDCVRLEDLERDGMDCRLKHEPGSMAARYDSSSATTDWIPEHRRSCQIGWV